MSESIKNIDLGNNEQIIIVDHNCIALVDSNSSNYEKNYTNINSPSSSLSSLLVPNSTGNGRDQQQQLASYSNLESVKKALGGKNGTNVEAINGIKLLTAY